MKIFIVSSESPLKVRKIAVYRFLIITITDGAAWSIEF